MPVPGSLLSLAPPLPSACLAAMLDVQLCKRQKHRLQVQANRMTNPEQQGKYSLDGGGGVLHGVNRGREARRLRRH